MSHIFVSYSRKDIEFAGKIVEALAKNNLETWIDWKSIPKGEDWEQQIYRGIEEADAFLFLISPDSAKSEMCNKEIAHAVKNNKRVLPIVLRAADVNTFLYEIAKNEISKRNWVFCRGKQDDFDKTIEDIQTTIHTDYEWVQAHRRLQVKALEWERNHKENSFLLRGKDLSDAELQLATNSSKEPYSTDLQREYTFESRKAADRQRRIITGISIAGVVVLAMLAIFGFYQARQSENNAATAQANFVVAQTAQFDAENQKATAIANEQARATAQAKAEAALHEAKLKSLVNLAASKLNDRLDIALLLNIEALNIEQNSLTEGGLITAMQTNPRLLTHIQLPSEVSNITVDSSGNRIAFGGYTIGLIDIKTSQILRVFEGHQGWVYKVAFSPNGNLLASAGYDGTIKFWDPNSGKQDGKSLEGYSSRVYSLAFSHDGSILASDGCSADNEGQCTQDDIRIWDVTSRTQIAGPVHGHRWFILDILFSPDDRFLVSLGGDGIMFVWDTSTWEQIKSIRIPGDSAITYSPDGSYLFIGTGNNNILMFDTTTWEQKDQLINGNSSAVESIAISSDGKLLASGSTENTLALWDIATRQIIDRLIGHSYGVRSVVFDPNKKILASVGHDNIMRIWSLTSDSVITNRLSGHTYYVNSVSFDPLGKILVSGSGNGILLIWDVRTKNQIHRIDIHDYFSDGSYITEMAFSPDGKKFAVVSNGGVLVWDPVDWKLVLKISIPDSHFKSLSFSPKGQILAIAGCSKFDAAHQCNMGEIRLLDTTTGEASTLTTDPSWIESVVFSPDGLLLVNAGDSGTIRVWDTKTRQEIRQPIETHQQWANSLAFSPDGKMLASGGFDKTIKLWNTSTWQAIGSPLTGHNGQVNSVSFSPDGSKIASASDDGTVRLWDVTTSLQIGNAFSSHSERVQSVSFSPDGSKIVSGAWDNNIYLYDISMESLVSKACIRVGRNFTRAEWAQYFPDEAYRITCSQWPEGQ